MAAWIVTKEKEVIIWHIEMCQTDLIKRMKCMEIVEITAFSHELDLILTTCNNIPTTNKTCMTWFGDHAKFIYRNVMVE